jgi:2-polyprenyl-6-methoxyphenol hydroxylase-like FAD-dependent oxidoreductase
MLAGPSPASLAPMIARAHREDRPGGHAVVIGASVAGLLAARALSEVHDRVTIVERDTLPPPGQGRRAVPQGRHAHALLAGGLRAIEELLPGIGDDLLAAGAVPCAGLAEMRVAIAGHELTRTARAADCLLAGRPLIEGQIRRRVLASPNISVVERCDAAGLMASPDRRRVIGVHVRGGAEEELAADLVVAATGRGGRVPAWLEALGYPRPGEEQLAVDLTYASRRIRLRPGALAGDKLVLIGARPGVPRGLALLAQEDGVRLLTLSGYGAAHRPPTGEHGYLRFAATVAPPDVFAAIRDAEPLGPVVTHGFPSNRRRRYERLRRLPDGLLVTGDAVASFNPLYGQGMSVAALEAAALSRCLARGERQLARRFHRAAARVVDQAWGMAIGGDLALPEVAGHRPLSVRIGNAYVERLLGVAEHDPVVAGAFASASDLIEPPRHILRPRVCWRVMRGGRRREQGAGNAAAAPAAVVAPGADRDPRPAARR